MSEFLDELARTMATAMPRRRALRVLGAAVVTAWAGGATSVASARRQAHWCHTEVRTNGWKFCTPETEACFPTCCPRDWSCSIGKCGSNGCCEITCCDPCKGLRPDGKGGCARGPIPDDCGPKRCGPDITDALEDALSRVKSEFVELVDSQALRRVHRPRNAAWSGCLVGYQGAGPWRERAIHEGLPRLWNVRKLGPGRQ